MFDQRHFPATAIPRAAPTHAGWILAALATTLLAMILTIAPARAQTTPSVEGWEQKLDRAGAASDYETAANIITGPVIQATRDGIRKTVADWLKRAFAENGFRVDTISVMSTAEHGERRLFALYHDNQYAFLFVVFHKRDQDWTVLNFSLEPNYPAIRERF